MERQHPSQLQVEGDCTSYHVCYFIRTHLRGFTARCFPEDLRLRVCMCLIIAVGWMED